MVRAQACAFLKRLLLLLLLVCPSDGKVFPAQQKQWTNCNNCYAVVAYDILRYHQPRLNVSVKEVMQTSRQTCNGGTPTLVWKHYFPRGSRKTSGSLLTLKRILRTHGPCAVNYGKGHLVTAVQANERGVLIRDPATGQQTLLSVSDAQRRRESVYFNYIAYPLL